MPGKHVHFSTSDYPPTPSPTYSSTSLPSSGGPHTPLSGQAIGSPYHHTHLPGCIYTVNPVLGISKVSPIAYGVSYPPSTITSRFHTLPPHVFDEPATKPGIPTMIIKCTKLPWTITIIPRSQQNEYVTVGDVFDGLYRALRINVTAHEFNLLPSVDAQHTVNSAYKRRCKRLSDALEYEAETRKGLKRVDFLGEHTSFSGLSSTKEGAHVWALNVS